MTSPDQHKADAALRHDTARLLQGMADAIMAGKVRRWQIECCATSIAMLAHVMGLANGTTESSS